MNEYISHQTNGLLYDLDKRRIDFQPSPGALARLSKGAMRTITAGYDQWQKDQDRLKSIVLADERRWSTKDYSSHFRNLVRSRASERARAA